MIDLGEGEGEPEKLEEGTLKKGGLTLEPPEAVLKGF